MKDGQHKPSLSYLRIFGCLAYAYVKQGKLEPRVKKCLFIGYPSGVKGYKLWNLESDGPRTIVTRDATFDESSTIKLDNLQTQLSLGKEKESVQVESSGLNPSNSPEQSETAYEF